MNRILLILTVIPLLCSCKDPEPEATLNLSPTGLTLDAVGSENILTVTTDADWKATTDADWLTLSPASGSGNGEITVKVSGNDDVSARKANISVSIGHRVLVLPVKQNSRASRSNYNAAELTASWQTGSFAFEDNYREYRGDRTVAIFYFVWLGAHGYDKQEDHNSVQVPKATDTKSPYDNSVLIQENPSNPAYGPLRTFHHWGKPYFNYYVSNDRWVIRKHAQMLTDAGVDVIFIDITNTWTYSPTVEILCEEYMAMRAQGAKTPQIAFVLWTLPASTLQKLYDEIYKPGKWDELLFKWRGKPLALCPSEGVSQELKDYFTLRSTWYDTGEWRWGARYPQPISTEQMSVTVATHPITTPFLLCQGRSNDGYTQPVAQLPKYLPGDPSENGTYFKVQAERALQYDPELVFITGWNEWCAGPFQSYPGDTYGVTVFAGNPIKTGDLFFVDQYSWEFSRDIEPADGYFGDNYYYYMVDFIRKYKGVQKPVADESSTTIAVDGAFGDWQSVTAVYADDKGDIGDRNHFGYGRIGQLTNTTGRNDIVETRVASDADNVYFYVRTASDLSPYTDPRWMRLFIDVIGSSVSKWENFGFVVNHEVKSATQTTLKKAGATWADWQNVRDIDYRLNGNEMELVIPRSALGIGSGAFELDFKWVDNAIADGDIKECMSDGDSAPNSRFRYRYSRK
ncbi:MAG: hypothetical protein LBR48_06065 [Dysgonamonadaceae bacterium]|nr:hypothetical protein [Dysgonamonadaceae bacterium]